MCVCVLSKRVSAMGPYGAIWAYVHGGSNVVDIGADLIESGCSDCHRLQELGARSSINGPGQMASINHLILR